MPLVFFKSTLYYIKVQIKEKNDPIIVNIIKFDK